MSSLHSGLAKPALRPKMRGVPANNNKKENNNNSVDWPWVNSNFEVRMLGEFCFTESREKGLQLIYVSDVARKDSVRLQVLTESDSSVSRTGMLVASGKKYTCSLSPVLAYGIVPYFTIHR